jgi:hypothetical protein
MRNISDKSCRENQNAHFVFNKSFLKSFLYERKRLKGIAEEGRPQIIKWRMRVACWIPKATNAYTGSVILTAFPLQQWVHERASIASLVLIYFKKKDYGEEIIENQRKSWRSRRQ